MVKKMAKKVKKKITSVFNGIMKLLKTLGAWALLMLNVIFPREDMKDPYRTWSDTRKTIRAERDIQNKTVEYCLEQPSDFQCAINPLIYERR